MVPLVRNTSIFAYSGPVSEPATNKRCFSVSSTVYWTGMEPTHEEDRSLTGDARYQFKFSRCFWEACFASIDPTTAVVAAFSGWRVLKPPLVTTDVAVPLGLDDEHV